MKTLVLALLLLPVAVGSVAAEEPGYVWSNADLLRLYGPAAENEAANEAAEDDGVAPGEQASWQFVESFIERQHDQLEDQRRYELDRREVEEEQVEPAFTLGLPGWYPYPYRPRHPRRPIRSEPQQPPDHKMDSPSPRLDRTVDRINERRDRIEEPHRRGESQQRSPRGRGEQHKPTR